METARLGRVFAARGRRALVGHLPLHTLLPCSRIRYDFNVKSLPQGRKRIVCNLMPQNLLLCARGETPTAGFPAHTQDSELHLVHIKYSVACAPRCIASAFCAHSYTAPLFLKRVLDLKKIRPSGPLHVTMSKF